jgi:hypothetical protein
LASNVLDDAAMSQLISEETISTNESEVCTPQRAFVQAMKLLKTEEKCLFTLFDIKALLGMAGFSQKSRNRIIHLSFEEIDAIIDQMPNEDMWLWRSYLNGLQLLLSKMDQARKRYSHLGRPYVSMPLANATSKLACLKLLVSMDIQEVSAHEMQTFLRDREEAFYFVRILGKQSSTLENERISIRSCIQFLGLYSAELITPFVSKSSEFPDFESAADWFCSVKPHLDNNQVKRGWEYIEKSSEEWHQGNHDEIAEDISKLPDWKCSLKDQHGEWLNEFPSDNPYKIVPLTTPIQLHAESQTMHHCVVSYIHSCIAGGTRIFSILIAGNNLPLATAELSNHHGQWSLVQLKGKYNNDYIERTYVADDPLAIAIRFLVKWYNEKSPIQPIENISYFSQGDKL